MLTTLKIFRVIMLLFFTFFFVAQYFFYTPYYGNNVTPDLISGFMNGLFVLPNGILSMLHSIDWIDTPFYFLDLKNNNQPYLTGFIGGVITLIAFIQVQIPSNKINPVTHTPDDKSVEAQ